MTRQVRCECGYIARAQTDDDVIALILTHVAAEHPELVDTESAEDVRAWIELVPG